MIRLRSRLLNVFTNVLFALIGIAILLLVFRDVNVEDVWNQITEANFFWILLAPLSSVAAHWLRAIRWKMLAEPLGYQVPGINSFNAVMIGYMTNYAVPRLGEFMRAWSLKKTDKVPVASTLGTVAAERGIDLLMLVLFFVLTLLLKYHLIYNTVVKDLLLPFVRNITANMSHVLIIAGLVSLLLVLSWLVLAKSSAGEWMKQILLRFASGLKSVMKVEQKGLFLLYTSGIWLLYLLTVQFNFFAFDYSSSLDFSAAIMVFTFGALGILAPVQGGIGTFHYMIMLALMLLQVPKEKGLAFAVIAHGVSMAYYILIGAVSYFWVALRGK